MDPLHEIRERVGRRTEERRMAWLRGQQSYHFRWMITAITASVLVLVIAGIAKSLLFAVVAVFLALFAGAETVQYWQMKSLLSLPVPATETDRVMQVQKFYAEIIQPKWFLRICDWTARITFVALALFVSVLVVATSGFWMRVLYALAWGVPIASLALLWQLQRRRRRRELAAQAAQENQWGDVK